MLDQDWNLRMYGDNVNFPVTSARRNLPPTRQSSQRRLPILDLDAHRLGVRVQQLGDCALADQPPPVNDRHPITDLLDFAQEVARQEHGSALTIRQRPNELPDFD